MKALWGPPVVQGVLCSNGGCWTCFTSLVLAKVSPTGTVTGLLSICKRSLDTKLVQFNSTFIEHMF
jgi:hypothetical protein